MFVQPARVGLLLLLSILAARVQGAPEPIEIAGVEPSVLFPHGEPLVQIARLTVANRTWQPLETTVHVAMDGRKPRCESLGRIPPGQTTREIHVPDVAAPARLHVELRDAADQRLAAWEATWQPQRHWVVYVVKSTHTDLGYENYEHVNRSQLAQYIDDARRITDATSNQPDASRYRWTIEHLDWLRGCLDERPCSSPATSPAAATPPIPSARARSRRPTAP